MADRYEASYEAAFRHYVEGHDQPCCLLVSKVATPAGGLWVPGQAEEYEIQYYVNSPSFHGHIRPKQRFTCPEMGALFTLEGAGEIVTHEFRAASAGGEVVFNAQSFSNSYKVFTLLSVVPFVS